MVARLGRVWLVGVALLSTAPPLAAQEPRVLEGTVIAVQGDRAQVELSGSRRPSPGDSVLLGTRMEGIGDVFLEGRWKVSERSGQYAWIDPVGDVAKPLPGYAVAIFSDNPIDAPSDADPGVEVLYSRNFASGATVEEADGPYCRIRNTSAGLVMRAVAPESGCIWTLLDSDILSPPIRISTAVTLRGGAVTGGYGLQFGREEGTPLRFTALAVSGNGSYALTRSDGPGWIPLTPWTQHPVVMTGIGARNEFTVELEGNTTHYSINGVHLGSHVDPGPVEGRVGFYLTSPGVEVLVENIRVERLGSGSERTRTESLMYEDFTDTSRWLEQDGPVCRSRHTDAGFSVQTVTASASCIWNIGPASEFAPSVRIDAVIGLSSGPTDQGYGIRFAAIGEHSRDSYAFLVSGNGYYVLFHWNDDQGSSQPVRWQPHEAINTGVGSTNRLTIEVRGDAADLYVNNRFVHTYTAPRALGGSLALYVNARDLQVVFKELRVEKLHGSR